MKTVEIHVRGEIAEVVKVPASVEVIVRDFDLEANDQEVACRVRRDKHGRSCEEALGPNSK